jgi:hypothetical protein
MLVGLSQLYRGDCACIRQRGIYMRLKSASLIEQSRLRISSIPSADVKLIVVLVVVLQDLVWCLVN